MREVSPLQRDSSDPIGSLKRTRKADCDVFYPIAQIGIGASFKMISMGFDPDARSAPRWRRLAIRLLPASRAASTIQKIVGRRRLGGRLAVARLFWLFRDYDSARRPCSFSEGVSEGFGGFLSSAPQAQNGPSF
jgi:hypothetical protein